MAEPSPERLRELARQLVEVSGEIATVTDPAVEYTGEETWKGTFPERVDEDVRHWSRTLDLDVYPLLALALAATARATEIESEAGE
ncbi:hypothetical protein [Brevibacterium litoralis]|uniref:hypothetical protein n=1 Tax=Brevibacterium litoralis TaxID=3138935 RepID=UPI0032ED0036